jgi:HAMP domain-containing protein
MLKADVALTLAAAFVTRRLLRPLTAIRTATRLIAADRYQASVPVPREPELAALAGDVNTLAARLADTETRRTRMPGEVAHEMRNGHMADQPAEAWLLRAGVLCRRSVHCRRPPWC